jgi:DNA-binding NarL/FixJ family response regulator
VTPFEYKIVVVSEHRILRQGLRVLLERPDDFHVLDDVDCKSALNQIERLRPTIVLLDLTLAQVETGLSLLADIGKLGLETRVIALVPEGANPTLLLRAIRSGAAGYVPEDSDDIHIVEEAIRKVGQGHLYLSNTALVSLLASISSHDVAGPLNGQNDASGLSPREYEVLELVAQGYTNRQISATLVISENTARTHVHNILDKLHLTNRVQVATFALKRSSAVHKTAAGSRSQWSATAEAGV